MPLRVRSLVGWLPLLAVEVLEEEVIHPNLPQFEKRMLWFLEYRKDLFRHIALLEHKGEVGHRRMLLALAGRPRLERALRYLLDEREFLSPYGVRSLSAVYRDEPYVFRAEGKEYRVAYVPGDMDTQDFGGNSNWRGPVWFPVNYLLLEALERYHHYYGDDFQVECPTGSGRFLNLGEVAHEIGERLARLFRADAARRPPVPGAGAAVRRGPALAGAAVVLRVLPRGHRAGAGGEPSDGVDRPGRPHVRRLRPEPRRTRASTGEHSGITPRTRKDRRL